MFAHLLGPKARVEALTDTSDYTSKPARKGHQAGKALPVWMCLRLPCCTARAMASHVCSNEWMNVVCVHSFAVSHRGQLPAVCGVSGRFLRVLHPLWWLRWEQGLHQHQHAPLHRCLPPVYPTTDPGSHTLPVHPQTAIMLLTLVLRPVLSSCRKTDECVLSGHDQCYLAHYVERKKQACQK